MKTRHVLLKLRVAVPGDFKTATGDKKIGVAFFKQSASGMIENNICYTDQDFQNNEAAIQEFKELFNCNQIYVFENDKEVRHTNCIDWHLINAELDYELDNFQNLKKRLKMGKLRTMQLCLTDIPKERIVTAGNGKKYLAIETWDFEKTDNNDNDFNIQVSLNKQEIEEKNKGASISRIFLGNGKIW